MGFFHSENGILAVSANNEYIFVEPWGKDSLRVRARMMNVPEDTRYALIEPEARTAEISIDGDIATVKNGRITCEIRCSSKDYIPRPYISFKNDKGEVLLAEKVNGGCLNIHSRSFKPRLGGDYELTMQFESYKGEKLYGMGQYQQEILDLKGSALELAQRNSQASVPFVLSSRGYGLFWHNPAVGRAIFAENLTEWYAESTRQLDYWITAGDTPKDIIANYACATGKAPMMPEFGLGFWQCKLRYWNQEQVLKIAREYKQRNIPIDVIVVDFFHWKHLGDFDFDREFFPDPDAMIKELTDMGIKLMVSVWPQAESGSVNYRTMRDNGYLIRAERGVPVTMRCIEDAEFYDATNPDARAFVWSECKKNYFDKGVALFWLDVAEPEYTVYDFDNYRYQLGPVDQIGNIYPQMYARTFYDGMKESGVESPVNLLRCAWAGSQRYGALVWSGDIASTYESFRKQICAGLSMGIAGIPWWTTDIGGFTGANINDPDFKDLLVRWFQWGAFCPVMRLHGSREPGEKVFNAAGKELCGTGADNEIWSYGEEVYTILKKYVDLRETLRDYTRGLMKEAHECGMPVMRTLFTEFPDDERAWGPKDEYMLGGDLLVAPVTELYAVKREVYLPSGAEWVDLHSGKTYAGGQSVTVDAPIDVIPVFARNNSHPELIGLI